MGVKRKLPPLSPLEQTWLRLRHPFRYPQSGHDCSWETFDADRAGCLLCGSLHQCANGMAGCKCPLGETEEGGHVCLITGLCIPEVRAAAHEFVDYACFERLDTAPSIEDDGVYERVYAVVHGFFTSSSTALCRQMEQEKYTQKSKQAFWQVLKQRKRSNPYELPCLCSVLAEVVRMDQSPILLASNSNSSNKRTACIESIVQQSSVNITQCILQINRMGFRKLCQGGKFQSMVVGMLYMSRAGLSVGSIFTLCPVRYIEEFLPSETYLGLIGVSNKVICDTENEIKSCIRTFAEGVKVKRSSNNVFVVPIKS